MGAENAWTWSLHLGRAQQAHEKVQGPPYGWGKGEAALQQCEGCIPLELQEEKKAQEEVPQQLAARLAEELARRLASKLPARLTDELISEPMP